MQNVLFNSGIYVLILHLNQSKPIYVGKLGKIYFNSGYYAYIGSAQRNLVARIKRHLTTHKKLHWHIDYLLQFANIERIFLAKKEKQYESKIAIFFQDKFAYVNNFGCTDSNAKSHLFYFSNEGSLKKFISILQDKFNFVEVNFQSLR